MQIITAAIYKHPHGQELRVFLEPEEKNDLLWSSVERFDFTPLEQKASDLRSVLLEKGWIDWPDDSVHSRFRRRRPVGWPHAAAITRTRP